MSFYDLSSGLKINIITSVLLYVGQNRINIAIGRNGHVGTYQRRTVGPVFPMVPIGIFRIDLPSCIQRMHLKKRIGYDLSILIFHDQVKPSGCGYGTDHPTKRAVGTRYGIRKSIDTEGSTKQGIIIPLNAATGNRKIVVLTNRPHIDISKTSTVARTRFLIDTIRYAISINIMTKK